jgi:hypothetical protein
MHKVSHPPRILKSRIHLLAKEAQLALAIGKRLGNAVLLEAECRIPVPPSHTRPLKEPLMPRHRLRGLALLATLLLAALHEGVT